MTALYNKLILLFVAFVVLSCNNKGIQDSTCPPEPLAMSVSFTAQFIADVDIDGHSFQTGPYGTKMTSDYLPPVQFPNSLLFSFYLNDDNGTQLSIELTPIELAGKEQHAFFDSEVTMKLSRNSLSKEYPATVTGNVNVNTDLSFAKQRELGIYTGDILLTWNDGESSNTFHITKFCVLPQPESPAD